MPSKKSDQWIDDDFPGAIAVLKENSALAQKLGTVTSSTIAYIRSLAEKIETRLSNDDPADRHQAVQDALNSSGVCILDPKIVHPRVLSASAQLLLREANVENVHTYKVPEKQPEIDDTVARFLKEAREDLNHALDRVYGYEMWDLGDTLSDKLCELGDPENLLGLEEEDKNLNTELKAVQKVIKALLDPPPVRKDWNNKRVPAKAGAATTGQRTEKGGTISAFK